MPYSSIMNKLNADNRSKITVRIHAPILEALNRRTEEACLRRDALISRALEIELPRIQRELLHRNSDRARRFISAHLKVLFASVAEPRPISLALDPAVAELLDTVCAAVNVPRETLLNRLLLLLGGSGTFWDDHFFDFTPPPWTGTGGEPELDDVIERRQYPIRDFAERGQSWHTVDVKTIAVQLTMLDEASQDYDLALSPLGRVASIVADPLRWYRNMLAETAKYWIEDHSHEKGATAPEIENILCNYTPFAIAFEDDEFYGLNCYMSDEWLDSIQNTQRK